MSDSRKPAVILMAEDDEDDVMLAEDAFKEARLSNRFICVDESVHAQRRQAARIPAP